MNFNGTFDFTVKPVFKELEENDKLLEYSELLELEIMRSEEFIKWQDYKPFFLEPPNNINQYIKFSKYDNNLKLIEKQKEYLKVLKEIETELNEYLEEVVKKLRNDLNI